MSAHLSRSARRQALLLVGSLLAVVTLGCSGKSVDLDANSTGSAAGASPTGADVALLDVHDDPVFGQISVDDERIYWIASSNRVQSCRKDDCVHTVTTYSRSVVFSGDQLTFTPSASLGNVFWLGRDPSPTIYTCPRDGCQGAPVAVVSDPYVGRVSSDGSYVYWKSALDLYRCPATGCGASPEVVARGEGATPVFYGADAFWIGGVAPDGATRPIRRAPKDGSSSPSTVFNAGNADMLRVFGDDLYWLDEGGVRTCPISGCNGEPRLIVSIDVISGLNDETLNVDGSGVYWLNTSNIVEYCPLTGCSQAIAVTPEITQSFTVDADYIYWTSTTVDAHAFYGLGIHRLPKPETP